MSGSPDREDEFVRALAACDAAAWRQLFDEQYARVYRHAYVRTGSAADADDIASSVFVEAVRGIRGFEYRGIPVASWLLRIAHNETVDLLKRRRRTAAASLDGLADGDVPHGRDEAALGAEWRDVRDALAKLKQEHREVIQLRLVEGRSVSETAAALGKSEAAVKMTQMRALESLRRKLGR